MTSDLKQTAPVMPKKRRKIVSLDKKKARAGWIFVLPFIIGLVLIYIPVVINSIWMTFCHIEFNNGYTLKFVGLANYDYAFNEHLYFKSQLLNTLKDMVIDIPAIVIFALFMALLLNQDMKGRAAFRAIFFVPVILSTGLIDQLDFGAKVAEALANGTQIDDGSGVNTGEQFINMMDLSALFQTMRIGSGLVDYVITLVNNILEIVNKSGVQMLIFLSGLQSISPSIYESCAIEGASGWETFWKITLPMVSPMILVNAVYTTIDSFTSASNPVMTEINKLLSNSTIGQGQVKGAAMSWTYFIVVLLIVAVIGAILSAYTFYQRRD